MQSRLLCTLGRLTLIVTVATAAGCGQSTLAPVVAPVAPSQSTASAAPTQHVKAQPDVARVVQGPPADVRLLTLLRSAPEPPVETLPGLPGLDGLEKLPSAVVDSWQNGSAASSKSPGAVVAGTTVSLSAQAGATEWAMYSFGGVVSAAQLQQLKVETSAGSFGGDAAGYWVAVANYTKHRWEVLGRSSTATYAAPLSGSMAYLSPTGLCYCAVLISDGQSVTVERAGLTLDDSPWQRITLTQPGDGQTGQTPCIDFTAGNNPAVAWADLTDHHGYFAICDRTTGFTAPSSWSISPFETDPTSVTSPASPDAKVQWLDLLIDPGVQLPRISLLYTGLSGSGASAGNTCLGCTALGTVGQVVSWFNWRMAFSDGAYYTSMARSASDASYGIVYTAANPIRHTANPPRALDDMEYRSIVWVNPTAGQISTTEGQLYWGFGENWRNPHLRIGAGGKSTVVVNGATAWQEQADLLNWANFYHETNSLELGSLALAPDNTPGMSFSYTGHTGALEAEFVDFNGSFQGGPLLSADTLPATASNAVAEVSQLAYLSDSTPCIAYTYRTAQGIEIRFAFMAGQSWTVETVSSVKGTPTDPLAEVYLDLAIDSHDIPAVCWTQWTGANSAMVVALRGT